MIAIVVVHCAKLFWRKTSSSAEDYARDQDVRAFVKFISLGRIEQQHRGVGGGGMLTIFIRKRPQSGSVREQINGCYFVISSGWDVAAGRLFSGS